jgi:hypothetical protein
VKSGFAVYIVASGAACTGAAQRMGARMIRLLAIWVLAGAAAGAVAGALYGNAYVLAGVGVGAAAGLGVAVALRGRL